MCIVIAVLNGIEISHKLFMPEIYAHLCQKPSVSIRGCESVLGISAIPNPTYASAYPHFTTVRTPLGGAITTTRLPSVRIIGLRPMPIVARLCLCIFIHTINNPKRFLVNYFSAFFCPNRFISAQILITLVPF